MFSPSRTQNHCVQRVLLLSAILLMVVTLLPNTPSSFAAVDELSGLELLRISRIAQGGTEYQGLQNVTAQSEGFVNLAPFGSFGLGTNPAAAAVEVRFSITDYQAKETRRRLEVRPTGPVAGANFLVYTGSQGGGMFMGNEFRVTENAASRQWAMMGFDTLNLAANGQLTVTRPRDETIGGTRYYVAEARINSQDTVRYFINPSSFLIERVITRYNNRTLVEEERSDYRKVGCMMMPFRIVTRLNGQRLADLTIASYDVETVVPTARFTMTATPN